MNDSTLKLDQLPEQEWRRVCRRLIELGASPERLYAVEDDAAPRTRAFHQVSLIRDGFEYPRPHTGRDRLTSQVFLAFEILDLEEGRLGRLFLVEEPLEGTVTVTDVRALDPWPYPSGKPLDPEQDFCIDPFELFEWAEDIVYTGACPGESLEAIVWLVIDSADRAQAIDWPSVQSRLTDLYDRNHQELELPVGYRLDLDLLISNGRSEQCRETMHTLILAMLTVSEAARAKLTANS